MANISMWGKALRIIPRITKEEWGTLDIISRWLISTRAAVFIMTAIAAGIGGLLAFRDGSFYWGYFLAATVGLVLAHASNNLINDYIDYRRGIDKNNYYRSQYGPQTLEHGLFSTRQFWTYFLVTIGLAIATGIYLVIETGPGTLCLLLSGLFFLVFYTWPLKYIGLGELTVILVWGPLMLGGTYYVTSGGVWNWSVVLLSLVYAFGPTTVLFGKHTDKLLEDKAKKVFTFPVIIGQKAARYTTMGLWVVQYIIIGYLIVIKQLGPMMAIVLLALPKLFWAIGIFKKPRPTEEPAGLQENVWPLYLSAHAFQYNRRFSIMFLVGLILDVILSKTGLYAIIGI